MKIIIIGGGISGLTTAYWLHREGYDVTVIEKENRPGGSIRTEKENGYLIECGPNSTLDTFVETDDLCQDLGIFKEKIEAGSNAKNRYVVRDGRLRPLPTGPIQFLTTDLWSISGKLRLMCEPFIKKYNSNAEETIAQFVVRRTGQEFLDYAIDPFVTGVFAGNASQLSLKSCFPKMYLLEKEHGGLLKGGLFGRKKKAGPKRKMKLISFRDGLQIVPDAISKALGDRFLKGCTVTSVRPANAQSGFEVLCQKDQQEMVFKADKVIFATPAWVTAGIIHPISETLAATLRQIEYVPVVIIFTGFNRNKVKHPLDGFGFLIPTIESGESAKKGYNILGSIWSSTVFPKRAPDGSVAFTNILGGGRNPDILEYEDSELIEMTLRDLKAILGIDAKPDFIRIIRQPRAIPQYTIGHQERIKLIENELKNIPGLYLAGNYINGVSVGHCISEATKLTQKIKNQGGGLKSKAHSVL